MIVRKANKIPVRQDDAGDTPPVPGVESCSAGSSSAPAAVTTGSGRNSDHAFIGHRLIASEGQDELSDDLSDQAGTVVMIGSPFAAPFLWIPVHKLCAAPKTEPHTSP